jgi:hypothetical protein
VHCVGYFYYNGTLLRYGWKKQQRIGTGNGRMGKHWTRPQLEISRNNVLLTVHPSTTYISILKPTWCTSYSTNQTLNSDLHIPYVHSVLQYYIHKHRTALESHPNPLVEPLIHTTHTRRLKRRWTFDVILRCGQWTDTRANDITNSTLAYRELCTVFYDC